jgi:isopenicillin-N N-acyltransferase-like protein
MATLDAYTHDGLIAQAAALSPVFEDAPARLRGLPGVIDIRNVGPARRRRAAAWASTARARMRRPWRSSASTKAACWCARWATPSRCRRRSPWSAAHRPDRRQPARRHRADGAGRRTSLNGAPHRHAKTGDKDMDIESFPLYDIEGDARQCGQQYGRAAGDRIDLSLRTYRLAFERVGLGWDRTRALARRFMPMIEAFDAGMLREIEGVAEGAGVPAEDIVALNARSEMLYAFQQLEATEPPDGCTGVVVMPSAARDGKLIHAQNWDWRVESLELGVVLRIQPAKGPAMLTFAEAGTLARAGLNSAGIAVTGNFIKADGDGQQQGVPLALIRRGILQSELYANALGVVCRTARSISNNMILTHAEGEAVSLETCPAQVFWQQPEAGILVHANHFKTPAALARVVDRSLETTPDSLYRDRRVTEALHAKPAGDLTEQDVLDALQDRFGAPRAVCRSPSAGPGGASSATVATIVMDPAARKMRIAPAPFKAHHFTEYSL